MNVPLARKFRPNGTFMWLGVGGSLGLIIVVGVLGPSAAQPPLPQRGAGPPWSLELEPSPWLVSALLWTAVTLGAAGILFGLRAMRAGWHINPGVGIAAGAAAAVAMVCVPPMGSADVLVYAAYGRIADTGGDPYVTTAADLAATGDPIGQAVEDPWQDTPSVYGPVATGAQRLAAHLGEGATHATVWWLAAFGAIAYVAAGLLLLRITGGSAAGRSRVLLLWSLNPLLLFTVVNGAHLDGLGIVWAVAGLAVLRRSPVAAGLLVGMAIAVKLSFGLYALALAWPLRRQRRELAGFVSATAFTVVIAYSWFGLHALDEARAAARLVSFAMPSRLLVGPLESILPNDTARTIIAVAAGVTLATLAWWLWRSTSFGKALADGAPITRTAPDPTPQAIRAAAVLGLAWLLTATYSLPWYDVVAWAPFALLAASSYDLVLTARTTIMAAAYVPGRVVELPDTLDFLTRNLRGTVGPVAGIVLLMLAFRLGRRQQVPRAADQPVR